MKQLMIYSTIAFLSLRMEALLIINSTNPSFRIGTLPKQPTNKRTKSGSISAATTYLL